MNERKLTTFVVAAHFLYSFLESGVSVKKKIVMVLVALTAIIILMIYVNKDDTIHIATLGYYTSSTSSASVDAYRMVDYVIKELNSSGKEYALIRIELKDLENPEDLNAILKAEQIDVVIGPNTSSEAVPFVKVLQGLDIPVFITSVSSNVFNDQADNIFRLTDTLSEQVKQLAGIMLEKTQLKPIVIYYTDENIEFSESYAFAMEKIYQDNQIESELIKVGSIDKKENQELLSSKINTDVVLVVAGPGKAGIMTDLISRGNPDVTFFHTSWSKSNTTVEYMKNITNEVYSLGLVTPSYMEQYSEFTTMLAKQNLSNNSFVYAGYETTYFMDYVISETKSMKLVNIQTFIHDITVYQGHFNDFEFNKTGDGGRGFALLKIIKGEYVVEIDSLNY